MMGLMLASLACRKSSPNKPDKRSRDCGTRHGDPVDLARTKHGRRVRFRPIHVVARVNDDLFHDAAGRRQSFGQHLAAAAGSGEQKPLAGRLLHQRVGERFRPILHRHEIGPASVSRKFVGGARPHGGQQRIPRRPHVALA